MKPRERLLALGANSLTDGELVAILLRTGTREQSVVDMADTILHETGGIHGLFEKDIGQLMAIRGVGAAKATALATVMELSRRYFKSKLKCNQNRFQSPEEVYEYLRTHMAHDGSERFCVLFLDPHGSLIEMQEMFRGNHSAAPVFVSEIMKQCLALGASDLIVAHNHPSGNTSPSPEDRRLTARLLKAAALLDIHLRDHLIITVDGYRSMAETGEMG